MSRHRIEGQRKQPEGRAKDVAARTVTQQQRASSGKRSGSKTTKH